VRFSIPVPHAPVHFEAEGHEITMGLVQLVRFIRRTTMAVTQVGIISRGKYSTGRFPVLFTATIYPRKEA
jgi:hypothetical protein